MNLRKPFVAILLLASFGGIVGCSTADFWGALMSLRPSETKPQTLTQTIKLSAGEVSEPIYLVAYRSANIDAPEGTDWDITADSKYVSFNPTKSLVTRDDTSGGAFWITVNQCPKNRCPVRITIFFEQ